MGTFSSTPTEQNVLFDWILDIFPLSRTLHLKTPENNSNYGCNVFFLGLSLRISSSYELDNPECVYMGLLYIVCAKIPHSKIDWLGLDRISMIDIPYFSKIFFRNWFSKCPVDKHPLLVILFLIITASNAFADYIDGTCLCCWSEFDAPDTPDKPVCV